MKPAAEIENAEVREYARQAATFVEGFAWCRRITACTLGFAVAGVLGVFRVDLEPEAGADPTVWTVVGDVPPAYLYFESGDSWRDALHGYVEEMRAWVQAAHSGADVSELIPVNVPPTPRHAAMLASRLDFIERNFLDVPADAIEGDT
jgi:hypothetical protein